MRKASLLVAGLMALAPFAASAADSDISYRYVEGGYQHVDGVVDAKGAYVRGAYEFGTSGVYALGSYSDLSNDGFDINARPAEIGVGYHYNFTPRLHGIAEVAYQHTHTRFVDVEGYRGSLGVRGQMGKSFEGVAKLNYYNGADYASDTSGTLGIQYKLSKTWGVTGEVEFDGDTETYLVGVRASF